MATDGTINREHNIPQAFYEELEPYLLDEPLGDISADGIVRLWRSAITYGQKYPNLGRAIAEWTVTASSGSPVILAVLLYRRTS